MTSVLDTISLVTKVIFYALMLFFFGVLISILAGYFKLAQTQIPFNFMAMSAGFAAVSMITSDVSKILKKKSKALHTIPESDEVLPVETPIENEKSEE
ncbi:hypothetical protein KCG48_01030 [Proteiniclasticum sp. BAD-10]|uniref:Uncharacterized protein n=1 Tax=Proteiniclasticum sediminis TaxID=2804028 RepID=A0A941CN16_9CLOT|nr:hypothetical protein [Proteiniclasticum sediminis]MBR0574914.1 hypothetical protein [Proteiniclasticum sediminis]